MRPRNRLTDHTICIGDVPMRVYDAEVPTRWEEIAFEKGFDFVTRVKDRFHLALRCHECDELMCTKAFVLTTAEPRCPTCLRKKWLAEAAAAGLTFLRRDADNTQYFVFRAPCGHEVRRQMGLIRRIGAGEVGLRCEICLVATEQAEAAALGWTRLGLDPEENQNYRLYQHACGHTQRVARANMQTGRFGCGRCHPGWVAAPSYLYAMRFHLPDGSSVVKLGFSRNPLSRLRFQLARRLDQDCELLRAVPIPTGHTANCLEKPLHGYLKKTYPDAVVQSERFACVIKVKSEVYESGLEPVILRLLDKIARAFRRAKTGTLAATGTSEAAHTSVTEDRDLDDDADASGAVAAPDAGNVAPPCDDLPSEARDGEDATTVRRDESDR